jgi:hypothetical protein
MLLRVSAAVFLIAAATPAMAKSGLDTHEMVWNQAGKVPAFVLRPIAKKPCAAQARPANGRLADGVAAAPCKASRRS